MKKFIFLVVLALLAASCSVQTQEEETGFVSFRLSSGASIMTLGVNDGPRYLMMSIKRHCRSVVYKREIVELYRMGEGYLSEPLKLITGKFDLIEFLVLDSERQVIYATPIEGSSKAYLVFDPLPIAFQVIRNETTTLSPEILFAEGKSPEEFGYEGISFDVVETIPFKVRVYEWTDVGKELVEAALTVSSEGEVLFSGDLAAGINEVEVRDRFGTYTLTVQREGFDDYVESFSAEELKAFSAVPLDIYFGEPLTLSISGQVTFDRDEPYDDIGFPGVTVTLSGYAYETVVTDSQGKFFFDGLETGAFYTVSPYKEDYSFSDDWSGTIETDVEDVLFTASGPTHSISGSVWGPGGSVSADITVNTEPLITVQTSEWGQYTIYDLPDATYTLTPSSINENVVFQPAERVVTVQGFDLWDVSFQMISSYSVSGTVSYIGTKTGWVYINLVDQWGWSTGTGTSILVTEQGGPSWPFTIRGVRPGEYTLTAQMDNLGSGEPNPSNPYGSSMDVVTVENSDVGGVFIDLYDPPPVIPETPAIEFVFPSNQSAWVLYDGPTDENDNDIAHSYNVYWSMEPDVTKPQGMANFPPNWTGVFVATGLSDLSSYYFWMTAVADGLESAESDIFGPVTIGASTGDYTVSGDIIFDHEATGPLFVAVYSETGAFATYIDSPVSPQWYSMSGVPAGDYLFVTFIDMNNNGVLDRGDNHDGFEGEIMCSVTGNETMNHILGPLPVSSASVTTNHRVDEWGQNYGLQFVVEEGSKLWVKLSVSGPNLPGTLDFASLEYWDSFGFGLGETRPKIGDTYTISVTYADSTSDTFYPSVTGVIDSFPTPVSPSGSYVPGGLTPTFTWSPPAFPPPIYEYHLNMWSDMGGGWWADEIPMGTTSVEYNYNGHAEEESLTPGTTYYWNISVVDSYGNSGDSSPILFTP